MTCITMTSRSSADKIEAELPICLALSATWNPLNQSDMADINGTFTVDKKRYRIMCKQLHFNQCFSVQVTQMRP